MRSDDMKNGVSRAPNRSLMKALGWTDREINMPIVGIVSAQNEIIPGHMELVCDGIAMGHKGMKYSLCSRELIADSIEVMATAHPFDALVFIPNCDKIVPGMLMAAARLDIPSIFVSGGPMLAGHIKGGDKRGMSLSQHAAHALACTLPIP